MSMQDISCMLIIMQDISCMLIIIIIADKSF